MNKPISIQSYVQKVAEIGKKYQLHDPRTWGLIAFGCMALAVTWSGAKAIQINFDLQKKIVSIDQQNKVQELQNQTQKLKNEYLKTDEYKELAARRLYGKAAPGERVYIVPKDVAAKYVSPDSITNTTAQKVGQIKIPSYQKNFQDWMDFLMHRTPNE